MSSKKATLPQVRDLMQRLEAKNDSITGTQLRTFMERPDGPILPSDNSVVSLVRLPDDVGTDQHGARLMTDRFWHSPIAQLRVDPDGHVAYVTVIRGEPAVVYRDEVYRPWLNRPLADLSDLGRLVIRGFTWIDVNARYGVVYELKPWGLREKRWAFVGEERHREEDDLRAVFVDYQGGLLYAVQRGNHVFIEHGSFSQRLYGTWESEIDRLVLGQKEGILLAREGGVCVQLVNDEQKVLHSVGPVSVDHLGRFWRMARGRELMEARSGGECKFYVERAGYDRWFTVLNGTDDDLVYVVKLKDGYETWVRQTRRDDPRLGAAWQHVSELFNEREGDLNQLRYWATQGRYLFKVDDPMPHLVDPKIKRGA